MQNKVTKQSGSLNSLQKLQEDDKATELKIDEEKVDQSINKSNDPQLLSRCMAGTSQTNTDNRKLHKHELMFKNKYQLKPSSMMILQLLLIITVSSSSTRMYANANDIKMTESMMHTNANEIVRANTKALRRTNSNETQRIEKKAH